MKLDINTLKEIINDYVGYLFLGIIIITLSYFGYFFYQNIYLTVTEKIPLENIVIKEKININLYDEVLESLENKKSTTIDIRSWKNLFKG